MSEGNGQAQAGVEVNAVVQIALTPEGRVLLNVQPADLDKYTLAGILEAAKQGVLNRPAPPKQSGIVIPPPGLRV